LEPHEGNSDNNDDGKEKEKLKFYEQQMFLFLKQCATYHEKNAELLVDCRNCAISFCKDHEDDIAHKDHEDGIAHKDACAPLELCLRINLSVMNNQHNI